MLSCYSPDGLAVWRPDTTPSAPMDRKDSLVRQCAARPVACSLDQHAWGSSKIMVMSCWRLPGRPLEFKITYSHFHLLRTNTSHPASTKWQHCAGRPFALQCFYAGLSPPPALAPSDHEM